MRKGDSSNRSEVTFCGVEKLSFFAIPLNSALDSTSCWFCSLRFLLMVEFQWFLMELSVLPGRHLAMSAHLLPNLYYTTGTSCELR
jgi:hypothetical protein